MRGAGVVVWRDFHGMFGVCWCIACLWAVILLQWQWWWCDGGHSDGDGAGHGVVMAMAMVMVWWPWSAKTVWCNLVIGKDKFVACHQQQSMRVLQIQHQVQYSSGQPCWHVTSCDPHGTHMNISFYTLDRKHSMMASKESLMKCLPVLWRMAMKMAFLKSIHHHTYLALWQRMGATSLMYVKHQCAQQQSLIVAVSKTKELFPCTWKVISELPSLGAKIVHASFHVQQPSTTVLHNTPQQQ